MSKLAFGFDSSSFNPNRCLVTSASYTSAQLNREVVTPSQVMYSEAYTEYDEEDIFDMLEAVEFVDNDHGVECDLLAMVEFSSEILRLEEGY